MSADGTFDTRHNVRHTKSTINALARKKKKRKRERGAFVLRSRNEVGKVDDRAEYPLEATLPPFQFEEITHDSRNCPPECALPSGNKKWVAPRRSGFSIGKSKTRLSEKSRVFLERPVFGTNPRN